ncbi:MAG TPA: ComF family protein [Anaerolineales bacterium]|nr:ComF family protein [Anaerolineales bacterium]
MDRGLAGARRFLLDLLFPPRCAGCGAPGIVWCAACDHSLRRLPPRTCSRCGSRFLRRRTCSSCASASHRLPCTAFGGYAFPLDRALTHLKYRPDRDLAGVFAGWLADTYRQTGWAATCILPVPLSPGRQRQRGYNQVALIALALGAQLHMPVLANALLRVRETASQVGLTPAEREHNVRAAFAADAEQVRDHTPLVLDDVFTTGATLAACGAALRQAGADRAFGLTVARA